jgi:2,3-bisphosphoglycerate-independent phosphoglycerate mutase
MTDRMSLLPHPRIQPPQAGVALIILDGVGCGPLDEANAWHVAKTPYLDSLMTTPVARQVLAHGKAVGMPSDKDMGNSEVGHNAMGAGRVFDQGAKLVQAAVDEGRLFESDTWKWLLENAKAGGTLHFVGLLSDGNVHSHVGHLFAMIDAACAEGASSIRVHPLLDGRDVGEKTAFDYVKPLEERLAACRVAGIDARVASGGGRMVLTMDRYEVEWGMVERGWATHVLGEGRGFTSLTEAIETLREEDPSVTDQYLPPFVIRDVKGPVGPVKDSDAVIFFNFRGDRAIELTRAFEEGEEFSYFDRKRVPTVRYAGMMQYDGDLHLPRRFLVSPPTIDRTVGEYLALAGKRQLALSETHKYGHVTYFFNGNRSGKFVEGLERYVQVTSDHCDPSERPRMKAKEIVEETITQVESFKPHFIRLNFANGDMVGHSGNLERAVEAMEFLDAQLQELVSALSEKGYVSIVTADHGNCEEMAERDPKTGQLRKKPDGSFKPKTSHTLNPVPVAIVGDGAGSRFVLDETVKVAGVANLAATALTLLGFLPPVDYEPSLVRPRT